MAKRKKQQHPLVLLLCFLAVILSAFFYDHSSDSPFASADTISAAVKDSALNVHFIDVGQGDSTLIESNGHYMLIDAGENNQADTVIDYLREQNVSTLDYVIGTHPHSDHIGGLDKIIEAFDIGKVILPSKEHTTRTFEDLLDAIAGKGLKITKPAVGDIYEIGDASFQILAPNQDYGDDLNNWSVAVRLVYGDTSFVFTGDAETEAEADIITNGLMLQADVLKVGHHGSRTSSNDAFLDSVKPSYAVIECGADNSYGHPHKETMEKLEKRNILIYRTDTQGNIVASTDGTDITWITEE